MKRFIVIGLGNFGSTLAVRLHELGHEVIALDARPDVVDSMGHTVSQAVVGDATKKSVLVEAGVRDADAAIISTGDEIAASVLCLLALRDLGIQRIYIKVISDEHSRIVDALGAEEAVFPERQSALGLASRLVAGALLRYVELGPGLAMQEMAVPAEWQGRTLRALALPQEHRVQVVALHDVLRDVMMPAPDPDRALTDSDTLLVAGDPVTLARLASLRC